MSVQDPGKKQELNMRLAETNTISGTQGLFVSYGSVDQCDRPIGHGKLF